MYIGHRQCFIVPRSQTLFRTVHPSLMVKFAMYFPTQFDHFDEHNDDDHQTITFTMINTVRTARMMRMVGAADDGNDDDDTDRTSMKWLSMSTNSGVHQNCLSAPPTIFFRL